MKKIYLFLLMSLLLLISNLVFLLVKNNQKLVDNEFESRTIQITKDNDLTPQVTINKTKKQDKIRDDVIWHIDENRVEFRFKNLFKNEDKNLIFALEKESFKDLFYRLDYNSIKVDPLNFGEKTFYLVYNVFFEAEGYSLYSALILDLENKEILYQTSDLIKKGTFSSLKILENGDIKISTFYPNYDYCRSCAFEIVDFIRYQQGKFISVNTHYKDEFKRIFDAFKKEDGCYILPGEKRLSFEEIKAQYGEDYQCRASDINLVDFRGATPKEYYLFKEKIAKIIGDQETWILH